MPAAEGVSSPARGKRKSQELEVQIGPLRVAIVAEGAEVVGVRFLGGSAPRALLRPGDVGIARLKKVADGGVLGQAAVEIAEYLCGARREFSVSVSLSAVRSDFQRRVLEACRGIPYGSVVSYGQLAEAVAGSRKAARAVGRALATNPVPIFVPCHRVVAADGSLGGFGWGLEWKEFLLRLEAAGV